MALREAPIARVADAVVPLTPYPRSPEGIRFAQPAKSSGSGDLMNFICEQWVPGLTVLARTHQHRYQIIIRCGHTLAKCFAG